MEWGKIYAKKYLAKKNGPADIKLALDAKQLLVVLNFSAPGKIPRIK